MKIVLAAIQADACAQPILNTATALADLFDANLAALHVRENDNSSPRERAAAFGAPLREFTGLPIEQLIAAAADPEVAALALGARGVHGGPNPRATRHSRSSLACASRSPSSHPTPTRARNSPASSYRSKAPATAHKPYRTQSGSRIDANWRSSSCTSTPQPPCPRSPITNRTQQRRGSTSSYRATSPPRTTGSACSASSDSPPTTPSPSPTSTAPI